MRSLAAVIGLLTGLGVLSAQVNVFYRRDFNSGVPPDWSLNTNDLGSTTTGRYNEWIVGADYNNPPPTFQVPCFGFCLDVTNIPPIPPQPAAIQGAPNSAFLHVSYVPSYSTTGGCSAPATRTTSFLAADGICNAAQKYFARMNTAASIPAGPAPVKLSFFWVCNGNSNGYGEVYYSTNGGNTWNILTSSVTNTQWLVDRSAQWNADTITLPITRPANVLIGFRFVNNANADEDPPLAVDDIAIFEEVPQTGPTITLQPPVSWVCNGDGFTVSFTTSGTFGANNTFSVQLSDATGSFANPTVIGSGGGTPIACVMPATTPSGNYKIRVVASDPAGTVSNEQPISVANLSGLSCSVSPVPVPAGQTATFTVGGNGLPAGSYNISFTPGNSDPNQNLTNQTLPATLTHTYNADGQYTAQIQVVHTPSGCVKTCNVTVFVGQQALTLTAFQPTAVCAGETFTATYQGTNITFGTGNLFILEITDGGGNVVSRCTTTSTAAQGTLSCAVPASLAGGSYTVRLVSTNPPFQSGTQPLTVLSKPVADFTPSDTILNLPAENVVIFTNNSTGAVSYTWDFGNGQTSTQATPDPVFYTTPGTYRVMLIATSAGGCRDTAMAVITARAAEELIIPNAFTPNGDGVNDRFVIWYSGAERIEVSLYDRWGNPVWSQAQTALSGTLEWDGTIKGSPAPESVYTGAVRLKTITGKEVVKGFTVTLLR
jgi:gliding motility-associated-like protein